MCFLFVLSTWLHIYVQLHKLSIASMSLFCTLYVSIFDCLIFCFQGLWCLSKWEEQVCFHHEKKAKFVLEFWKQTTITSIKPANRGNMQGIMKSLKMSSGAIEVYTLFFENNFSRYIIIAVTGNIKYIGILCQEHNLKKSCNFLITYQETFLFCRLIRGLNGNETVMPALGMAWSSMVTVRLMLSRTKQPLQACVKVCCRSR